VNARRARPFFAALAISLCLVPLASGQTSWPPRTPPGPALGSGQKPPEVITVSNASIDRLRDWLEAIGDHTPGAPDAALATVASWPQGDTQMLWINATVLLTLMDEVRAPGFTLTVGGLTLGRGRANVFTIQAEGKPAKEINYNPVQLRRLKLYACAAVAAAFCPETLKPGERPLGLDRLTEKAAAATKGGDLNFVLRRGAMLHADVAMSGEAEQPFDAASASPAPRQMRLNILDGSAANDVEIGIHWVMGRLLLDDVIPAGERKPAPGRDAFVRDWYRATAAWMQDRESHDTAHFDRAHALFPRDADILFLNGCEREAYAAPRIHAAVGAAVVPVGFNFDIGSDRAELRRAEEYFRRALVARPDFGEARLRLGRVLLLRGQGAEASIELRRAMESAEIAVDNQLLYYAHLLAGTAYEAIGRIDIARASFEKAAGLYPTAQSPLLALSQLATRRGERVTALRELQRVFALPPHAPERDDPWWEYFRSQARNADTLIERLQAGVGAGERP
jgi:tetratricopeptide (TPR) repeat protein